MSTIKRDDLYERPPDEVRQEPGARDATNAYTAEYKAGSKVVPEPFVNDAPTFEERERIRQTVMGRLPQAVKDGLVVKGPGVYVLTAADLQALRDVRDQIPRSGLFPALTRLRNELDALIKRMERQER